MKTLCTLLLALGTICSIQAQERKVNQPPFIVRNTSTVEINQITLSDTATVLDIKAYYRPHNWIRISGESYLLADNGKKYPIRSGSGITLDKEFWMPDSGEATFSLIFPTLPATVKTIDFIESDCEDCFKIWGITRISVTGRGKTKNKCCRNITGSSIDNGKSYTEWKTFGL